jgi:thioredoxin-like negative regulator of GroEL
MQRQAKPIPVTDGDLPSLLAATPGAVVVKATMNPCMPCEKLRPVVHKLSAEFADRMTVLEVDDSAEEFCRTWRVSSFPQLLFFRDGQYVRRLQGFENAGTVRESVLDFLGVDEAPPSAAELAFQAACERAEAAIEEAMAPASQALEPHLDAIERATQQAQARLAARDWTGLTPEQIRGEMQAEYKLAYAPFADKIAANSKAQALGMARYGEIMQAAVEDFARDSRS